LKKVLPLFVRHHGDIIIKLRSRFFDADQISDFTKKKGRRENPSGLIESNEKANF